MPPAVADFKLSITRALADQLSTALEQLSPAPLTTEELNALEARPGIYELYLDGQRVYVGKAKANLPARLDQHRQKLSGRRNIDIAHVGFKCLYVDEDLDSASPERMLINAYSAAGTNPWNNNGFGNKDPGRNRDRTEVKAAHFDAHYPINLDLSLILVDEDIALRLDALVDRVKAALPYNLRRDKKTHIKDLREAIAVLPAGEHTVRELIELILGALPMGWQVTALPGYLILYREHADYPSANFSWTKGADGSVVEMTGRGALAAGALPQDPADGEDSEGDDGE